MNEYYTKKLINLNQGFNSFKEINITNSNDYFLRGFTANLRDIALVSFKVDAIQAVPRLVLEIGGISLIMIFLYINYIQSPSGDYDYFATLSLFALSGLRMLPSANKIVSSINRLRFSGPAVSILENEKEQELTRFTNNEGPQSPKQTQFNRDHDNTIEAKKKLQIYPYV